MLFSLANVFENFTIRVRSACVFTFTLVASITLITGCSPQTDSTPNTRANLHNDNAGNQTPVTLRFTPRYRGTALTCEQALDINERAWRISEFAMFVSEFSINNSEFVILDDNDWQSQQVALIRSAADCKQSMHNYSVHGSSTALGELTKAGLTDDINVSFIVGVPFGVNHQNPLLQASPLNDSSMFWVWRNGYKFVRWDMQTEGTNTDSWSFHLGSVGCESAAMVRAPLTPCSQPNTVTADVSLTPDSMQVFNGEVFINISINLDNIIKHIVPTRENTCMFSGIDNSACQQLLTNMNEGNVFE